MLLKIAFSSQPSHEAIVSQHLCLNSTEIMFPDIMHLFDTGVILFVVSQLKLAIGEFI